VEIILVSATRENPRALGYGILHMLIDKGALRAADERPNHSLRIMRVADLVAPGTRGELLTKLVEHRRLDDDARVGHANLALVEVDPETARPYGVVHIGVAQHDEGILAADFQRDFLQVFRGFPRDELAHLRRAGERDHPHPGIADQRTGDLARRA